MITAVRGNTLTTLRVTLQDDGVAINLTGATSLTLEARAQETALTFTVAGTIFDALNGKVDFAAIGDAVSAVQMAGARRIVFDAMIKLIDATAKVGSSDAFEIEVLRFPVTV